MNHSIGVNSTINKQWRIEKTCQLPHDLTTSHAVLPMLSCHVIEEWRQRLLVFRKKNIRLITVSLITEKVNKKAIWDGEEDTMDTMDEQKSRNGEKERERLISQND